MGPEPTKNRPAAQAAGHRRAAATRSGAAASAAARARRERAGRHSCACAGSCRARRAGIRPGTGVALLARMASVSGFGFVDSLVNDLVGQSAGAAFAPAAFAARVLPSALTDSSASLAGSQLADLLSTARASLLGLASTARQLDLASPLSAFFSAAASSSNPSAILAQATPGSSVTTAPPQATYTFSVSQVAV